MKTRVLILRTAGINCDEETVRAFEAAGARVDLLHLNALIAARERLQDYSILVLPGGFSYGDDLAAGRVFGVELREHLALEIRAFLAAGGYLLGICNGFQVLVELGVFEPELAPHERRITLTDNASHRFEARWVTLRVQASAAQWLVPGELYPCPVAHGEGQLALRDPSVLQELERRRQIALVYVDPARPGAPAGYPANPNGSVADIAGLTDPSGRVLGLMPHLERNLTPFHHPHWTRLAPRSEGEGLRFFRGFVAAAAAGIPLGAR
jgi:phosphoribosylformylglycinamidine synthase